jgi:hypothetical protein
MEERQGKAHKKTRDQLLKEKLEGDETMRK